MTPKERNDALIFFVMIIGIGLEFFGYHLVNNDHKKFGYSCMAFGLVILFANTIIAIMKIKK